MNSELEKAKQLNMDLKRKRQIILEQIREEKINRLSHQLDNTEVTLNELEAILAHLSPSNKNIFQANTLLALRVINRFAMENKIRVEDAINILTEYCT